MEYRATGYSNIRTSVVGLGSEHSGNRPLTAGALFDRLFDPSILDLLRSMVL